MDNYITKLMEAVMKSLEKHGLIPTAATIIGLLICAILLIIAYQLPEIIMAIKALLV